MAGKLAIGIDLGTTFCCAAVYREGKGVDVIPDENGDRIIPSVVYFDPNKGEVLVGKNAIDETPEYPQNGLYDAKRMIGRKFDDQYVSKLTSSSETLFSIVRGKDDQAVYQVSIAGEPVTKRPEDVSAEMLKYMKRAASEHLGCEITEAVISVPAYFSNAQRKATKRAAELADLEVLRLITEPTAAAIHYVSDKKKENANILVFDFGGGTLDVSIIKVVDKQFEVKAVYGDTFLGGRNIDEILFNHFQQKYATNSKVNQSRRRIFLRRLRTACVELKKKLSTRSEARLSIPSSFGGDEEVSLSLSREEFEKLNGDLFERAVDVVKICLYNCGMSHTEIDEVILVGGTTRVPKIREMISDYFGEGIIKTDLHPDEAVAAGASVQAALLRNASRDLERYKITEVTPLSLGIETGKGFMEVFIARNSFLPAREVKRKFTTQNNQAAVRIPIYEGERANVAHNNLLGEFIARGFPPERAGDVKYDVIFELDEDGVLNVTVTEDSIGVRKNLTVTMGEFRLTEKNVKLTVEEAKKYRYADEVFEAFARKKNDLEILCQHIVYDSAKIECQTDRELVREACREFLKFSDGLDFMEIERLEARFAMSSPAIGIDLGTTFCCAAVYRQGRGVEVISDESGDRIIPSIVYFYPDTGKVLVGKHAVDEMLECPSNGLFDAKRIIGRKYTDQYVSQMTGSRETPFSIVRDENGQAAYEISVAGEPVTKRPEDVSAEMLKYMKRAASSLLGCEITEAVISVPAYFSNAQRKATKRAAELADLKLLRLITEPTAAAIHYVSDKEKENANILVFDFGGGTLDVSIIKVIDKQFEVKAVYGDTFLGGRNIDDILFDYFQEKCLAEKTISPRRERMFLCRLRAACEELKKRLSTMLEVKIPILSSFGGDEDVNVALSRAKFEELTQDLFKNAMDVMEICLFNCGMSKSEINEVILVGGTTRIPKIREMVRSYFGETVVKTDLHPDEAVAVGASIQAALLKNNSGALERYRITEVTPLSLGIRLNSDIMQVFIPRNTPLPFKAKRRNKTVGNNQVSIDTTIYEGERKNVKHNNKLGEFTVTGLPPARAGDTKFDVIFDLDEDGVLNVTVTEESIGIHKNFTVTMSPFRLTERNVKMSIEDAKKYKYEDEVFEEFARKKNKYDTICEQILYDVAKIASSKDQKFVRRSCKEFIKCYGDLDFTEMEKLDAKFAVFHSSIADILKENNLLQLL
ncbi:hypothetical protein NQ318_004342 [Aromia moschata]|uniref:Heat shock protein 70 n=1 Tax=Aromia moschata TaxID=1265417 RepID=A0AAV8YSP1_9CUCU|nr:hypothetical protein NQ318_004342 [Aromia moschata]